MRRSIFNRRIVNPEYISADKLYADFHHISRFYLIWYGKSEVIDIQPKVYAKGYASLYRITTADSQSTIIANSARITIIRSTMR